MKRVPPVAILRLEPWDWPVWRAVRLEALREAPYAFGSVLADWQGSGDTEARWRGRLESVPFNVVAVIDGRPVGQASGTEPDGDGYVELISMWVAPEVRGCGVGRVLVGAVVEWAERRGAGVVLSVKRANPAAIALYERCGFQAAPGGADVPDDEQAMVRNP